MRTQIQINRPLTAGHQRGAVTLLMAMILLVSTTLLSIYSAKTTVMEQRISSNEYQAMEVDQAASAGLEYALIWLGTTGNSVTWVTGTDPACSGTFDEIGTLTGPSIGAANSDTYGLSIVFCRNTAVINDVIQVASSATANLDASITKTVRVFVRAEIGPLAPTFSGAPLVLDGCMYGANGNPAIYLDSIGTAIEGRVVSAGCIDNGSLSLDGNGTRPLGTIETTIPALPVDLWDYVFVKTRAEIQALADAEVLAGIADSLRKYVWVTDTAPFHRVIGSATHFAVVVFSPLADCPKMNGSTTIYGVVFVDSSCGKANGWGGSEIHGSTVVNGDIGTLTTKLLNANTKFYQSAGLSTLVGLPNNFAPREIGTWSDF